MCRKHRCLSDSRKLYMVNYMGANRKELLLYKRKYGKANRAKFNTLKKEAYHSDVNTKLRVSLRNRINKLIRNRQKKGSAVYDLGCSVEELKTWLESKFKPGMTWENWALNGWHIDHVIPLSSFDLTDRAQFKKACHYTNLQPLWWHENLKKSARL